MDCAWLQGDGELVCDHDGEVKKEGRHAPEKSSQRVHSEETRQDKTRDNPPRGCTLKKQDKTRTLKGLGGIVFCRQETTTCARILNRREDSR